MIRITKDGSLTFTGSDELSLKRWAHYTKRSEEDLKKALYKEFLKGHTKEGASKCR